MNMSQELKKLVAEGLARECATASKSKSISVSWPGYFALRMKTATHGSRGRAV
jgi:hypothetical protein